MELDPLGVFLVGFPDHIGERADGGGVSPKPVGRTRTSNSPVPGRRPGRITGSMPTPKLVTRPIPVTTTSLEDFAMSGPLRGLPGDCRKQADFLGAPFHDRR